jgi:hypothetical protein
MFVLHYLNYQLTDHFRASREAKIELGAAVAARLKLSEDGTKVLWPQPTDSALDPQNWSTRRKNLQLFVITLASVVPDFDAAIGEQSVPFNFQSHMKHTVFYG